MKLKHAALFMSSFLAVLIVIVSLFGLLTPNFYSAETVNWQVQSIGQDKVDLFLIVPGLLITSLLILKNNRQAIFLWAGVVGYSAYTFFLYCFDVHFNKLFILYCLCLGISFYSCFIFFMNMDGFQVRVNRESVLKATGIYFIIIAVLFYLLWLAEIIPSTLAGSVPKSVQEAGLFTNGVHVLDLSIVLPGIFLTGILLLKRHKMGMLLAPAFLSFFILMDLTIGSLSIAMNGGIQTDFTLLIIMIALAIFSAGLLTWYFKSIIINTANQ